LPEEKAYANSSCNQSHLIIGSAQIAYINDEPSSYSNKLNNSLVLASIKEINPVIIAKPKNKKAVFDQLKL